MAAHVGRNCSKGVATRSQGRVVLVIDADSWLLAPPTTVGIPRAEANDTRRNGQMVLVAVVPWRAVQKRLWRPGVRWQLIGRA